VAVCVERDARDDDEHALAPAGPHPPVALHRRGVLPREVGALHDAQAVLRVERTLAT
jgi:hypothetical protein